MYRLAVSEETSGVDITQACAPPASAPSKCMESSPFVQCRAPVERDQNPLLSAPSSPVYETTRLYCSDGVFACLHYAVCMSRQVAMGTKQTDRCTWIAGMLEYIIRFGFLADRRCIDVEISRLMILRSRAQGT